MLHDLDVKILPELGDIVLEGNIADADDRQRDHNFRNPLATHGRPLPQKTALPARNIRLSIKSAEK
jgi:hypothetical protein